MSASTFVAPSAAASSVAPASRLYPDTLQCLFQLLPLRDAISAHGSCRAWRDAAYREPSRKLSICRLPCDLVWMSRSSLRHHVSTYSSRVGYTVISDPAQLALLRQFPNVTDLTLTLDDKTILLLQSPSGASSDSSPTACLVAVWPLKLTRLDVFIPEGDEPQRSMVVQLIIDSVARHPSLTDLRMAIPDCALSLQPLLSANTRALTLEGVDAAGFAVLKQMQSLERLTLFNSDVEPEMLQLLCAEPHQLARLSSLSLNSTSVTAAHLPPLLSLPALSALDLWSLKPDALGSLCRLRHLRDLRVEFWVQRPNARILVTHLAECSHLTALAMPLRDISRDELSILASALTAMQSLELNTTTFTGFDSEQTGLGCLRPMTQLRVLRFPYCAGLSLACLDSGFTSMRSLRELSLCLPSADVSPARALLLQSMAHLTSVAVK